MKSSLISILDSSFLQESSMTCRGALRTFVKPKLGDVLRFCGARFFCENPTPRLSPKPALSSFGVLLDIDGVLVRGRKPIPGAREALEMLRQSDVPTVFLTNGGCESEKEAAERLSDKIGFEVIPLAINVKLELEGAGEVGGGGGQGFSNNLGH